MEFIIFEYTINVVKRGREKIKSRLRENKRKEETKMKVYELKKLTKQIEEDTGRKVKLIGSSIPYGKVIIYFYLNDWLVHTYFLDELYSELITFSVLINALKLGKNPVEF